MQIYGKRKGRLTEAVEQGGVRRSSGTFRSMQRPRLVQQSKVDGGGRGRRFGRREDDGDAKRQEGENGKTPWPYL